MGPHWKIPERKSSSRSVTNARTPQWKMPERYYRGVVDSDWRTVGSTTVLRLRATSSCWNQSNPHGDTAELWFSLMKESR